METPQAVHLDYPGTLTVPVPEPHPSPTERKSSGARISVGPLP